MNDQSSGQCVRGEPWPAAVKPLKPRVHQHRGSQIRIAEDKKTVGGGWQRELEESIYF